MSAHYNLREFKKQLRAEYLARRRALSAQEKTILDRKIVSTFTSLSSYRYADTLLLYYPRPDEIDTRPILAAALEAGKQVALPRTRENGQMDFHFIRSEADLTLGALRIPEPFEECPRFDPQISGKSVLMIVPGLSFDKNGYRLGYGKGYYDRYLEHCDITTAGLVYSDFLVDKLPRGHFDLPVHYIVTEKGVTSVE